MTNLLIKQLINSGLSEKEARIYLALLELETATVYETAKQSGINRSSAYVVLEGLKKKGLVGISDDKKVRHYVAASPETLLHAAKAKVKKHEDIKSSLESIIPELKALHTGTRRRPIVKIFEGENGAREVYGSLFLTDSKEIRTYANPVNIFKRIPDFLDWFDKTRSEKGIKMLVINPATEEVLELYKHVTPRQPAEVVLIPKDKFKFNSDIGIFGDKVSFISPRDNFGILIESKDIADTLRNSFDLGWEEAKRLNKKIPHNKKSPLQSKKMKNVL